VKISDGALSGGVENYKEFWWTMVGLAAEGQNFDGNGEYVHFQPGGGANTISTGTVAGRPTDQLFGNALSKPVGTRPVFPGKRPPYRPDFPCYKNTPPDLNGVAANVGPPDASTGGAPGGTQPGSGVTLPPLPPIPGLPPLPGARKAAVK
jgi:phospholipid/cholesterol/gamma-HCH transport system substrate-binding protein